MRIETYAFMGRRPHRFPWKDTLTITNEGTTLDSKLSGVAGMRRFIFALFLSLMLVLAGCGMKQSIDSDDTTVSTKMVYSSDTSAENCYLCGNGVESPLSPYWGQNNIALISLNTFEIKPLEINRYDRIDGRLIEEYAGTVSFTLGSKDGGFSASLMQDSDRGYATGSVDFYSDEVLDINKAADFLCEDCLNEILPSRIDGCFGVGAVNLATGEVRIFEEHLVGFGLGDFYIDCDPQDQDGDTHRMDILVFYCPIRYESVS